VEDNAQVVGFERFQGEDGDPGEERGVDLEGGILGGRADQHDQPGLHVGEEGVLLRLVEAVDLVHEQEGRGALALPARASALDHLAHFLDSAQDGREGLEGHAGVLGQQAGQGGLAAPRGAPEDHGGKEPAGLEGPP
jgi:hypothetical protein